MFLCQVIANPGVLLIKFAIKTPTSRMFLSVPWVRRPLSGRLRLQVSNESGNGGRDIRTVTLDAIHRHTWLFLSDQGGILIRQLVARLLLPNQSASQLVLFYVLLRYYYAYPYAPE